MKKVALFLMISSAVICAGLRSSTEKVVKADTTVIIKTDTIYQVKYDTIRITKTYRDTSLLVKSDSLISAGKPLPIKKK